MQQVSVNKHSGQFLGHSARSRKISSNRSTHSEAFAEKPKQIFNVHENIIYQGFNIRIWGNLEIGHISKARFQSTDHLECA